MAANDDSAIETARRALLVEDDDGVRRALQLLLRWRGFEVSAFAAVVPALASDTARNPAILIADYRLPDGSGIHLLRGLRARGWRGRSVLITGFPTDDLRRDAAVEGFDAVLEKPLREQWLLAALGA